MIPNMFYTQFEPGEFGVRVRKVEDWNPYAYSSVANQKVLFDDFKDAFEKHVQNPTQRGAKSFLEDLFGQIKGLKRNDESIFQYCDELFSKDYPHVFERLPCQIISINLSDEHEVQTSVGYRNKTMFDSPLTAIGMKNIVTGSEVRLLFSGSIESKKKLLWPLLSKEGYQPESTRDALRLETVRYIPESERLLKGLDDRKFTAYKRKITSQSRFCDI